MITIKELSLDMLDQIKAFTDSQIGNNYFSIDDLKLVIQHSTSTTGCTSLVAFEGEKVVAIRLTRNAGSEWHINKKVSPELWNFDPADIAYFQSVFILPSHQGKGLGLTLSQAAVSALKKSGAKAVVTHSHVESIGNSSFKYLTKLGFKEVCSYPDYWKDVDYDCVTCQGNPCKCSAKEMILHL